MALVQLLLIVISIFLLWWLYRFYKANPKIFSIKNWNESFFTMGILALILIIFLALCICFLHNGGH